jgi:hypothetical protein
MVNMLLCRISTKTTGEKIFVISKTSTVALLFCFFVLISFNSVPFRAIHYTLIWYIFGALSSIIAFTIAHQAKLLVFTKYRCGLFFLLFAFMSYFHLPLVGHPLSIYNAILFFGALPLPFFNAGLAYKLFRYLRSIIIFVSVCSLIIFLLLLILPSESIPIPSFEMEPISAAHINGEVSYRIYLFVVTYVGYSNIFFQALGVSRICGFMSEPGHWAVFLSFILTAELFLYNKRSWILILCGLCTFSTLFYVFLFMMEMYIFFFLKTKRLKIYLLILLALILLLTSVEPEVRQLLWDTTIGRNIDVDKSLDDRVPSIATMTWNNFLNISSIDEKLFGFGPFALESKGIILADYREMIYDCGFVGLLLVLFGYLYIFLQTHLKQVVLYMSLILLIIVVRVWMFYMPYLYIFAIMSNFACDYYHEKH